MEAAIRRIRTTPYGLKGFSAFCRLLRLEDGSPMIIRPFQRFLLALYFGGAIELVVIMPKKNGKTTLMAALALYHLLMVPAAECVIGAASEEQAAILHKQARTMILQSGMDRRPIKGRDRRERVEYEGIFDVRPGIHEIRFELGRIRVLPADPRTAQGVIPTLALVDEYHCHPSSELYGIFRDGLTPRHGQMITITNPGVTVDSPLGMLRQAMRDRPCERRGHRRVYRSPDGLSVLIEWGLEAGEDPNNLRLVAQANPAPWQTPTELRRRRDAPSMTPGQWRRYGAGMWGHGVEEGAIPETVWDGLAVDIGGVEEGERVWCAVRSGAVAIVAQRGEGFACRAVIGPDQLERTEALIEEIATLYEVQVVAWGELAFARSAELLRHKGIPMIELPHRSERLMQVSALLFQLIRQGLLRHDRDPELRAHVLAGITKQSERGWWFVMAPETRGLIALAFAVYEAATGAKRKPMIHVWQGA